MMQKIINWTPRQYRLKKVSNRDEPVIRYEIEKKEKKYTSVVCGKGHLMIKLEWNSIEIYHKII